MSSSLGYGTVDVSTLFAFALAFFVFAASPGPDNITIIARTLHHGALSGLAYGAGTVTGILIFLVFALFGLSTIAHEFGAGMTVLRYAGAAYLVWIGIRMWTAPVSLSENHARSVNGELWRGYASGVVLNLGNPKMPLFYIALLPNVVGTSLTGEQVAMLAGIILSVEAVVIGGHVLLASRAKRFLRSPRALKRVNKGTGALMIGAGAAVVVAR